MSRRTPSETYELSKTDNVGVLVHPYGTKEVQPFETDDGRIMVRMDGETYQAILVRPRFNDPVIWVRRLIARHYRLGLKDQRRYIATCLGQIVSFLLVHGNIHCIPEQLNDFSVLLPVAIRKYRENGGELNLTKQKCRQEIT